jgi:hypothetical protein
MKQDPQLLPIKHPPQRVIDGWRAAGEPEDHMIRLTTGAMGDYYRTDGQWHLVVYQ